MSLHRASLTPGTWHNRELHAAKYITYMLDSGIPHLARCPTASANSLHTCTGYEAPGASFPTPVYTPFSDKVSWVPLRVSGAACPGDLASPDERNLLLLQRPGPRWGRPMGHALHGVLQSPPPVQPPHPRSKSPVGFASPSLNRRPSRPPPRPGALRAGTARLTAVPCLGMAGGPSSLSQRPRSPSLRGLPLTPCELMAQLQDALHAAGVPEMDGFTLHGLRRGAAQACMAQGASLDAIKEQGTQTSSARHTYVPRLASCVALLAIALYFGSARVAPTDSIGPQTGHRLRGPGLNPPLLTQ